MTIPRFDLESEKNRSVVSDSRRGKTTFQEQLVRVLMAEGEVGISFVIGQMLTAPASSFAVD